MYPEIEKGNLVNPLQVLAQLSCFFFNFKYPQKPARVRHCIILCFFLCLLSTLYLKGIVEREVLCIVLCFGILILFFFH